MNNWLGARQKKPNIFDKEPDKIKLWTLDFISSIQQIQFKWQISTIY